MRRVGGSGRSSAQALRFTLYARGCCLILNLLWPLNMRHPARGQAPRGRGILRPPGATQPQQAANSFPFLQASQRQGHSFSMPEGRLAKKRSKHITLSLSSNEEVGGALGKNVKKTPLDQRALSRAGFLMVCNWRAQGLTDERPWTPPLPLPSKCHFAGHCAISLSMATKNPLTPEGRKASGGK